MKQRIAVLILIMCILAGGCGVESQPPVLRVAVPFSDYVQDPSTNYYVKWLEEKTGLELDITVVRMTGVTGYLDAMFSSDAMLKTVFSI